MDKLWGFFNELGDAPTAIGGGILGLLAAIFFGFRIRFLRWWKPSIFHDKFITKADIRRDRAYFVPNPIEVQKNTYKDGKESYQTIQIKNQKGFDSVDLIYHDMLFDDEPEFRDQQYFVLLAPTGVGKTTFIYQLFLKHEKCSRRKNTKRILLGNSKAPDSDFWQEVRRCNEEFAKREKQDKYLLPENTILFIDGFDEDKLAFGGLEKEKKTPS